MGASVWASGSHVWNGNNGVLTANAMAKPRNSQRAGGRGHPAALGDVWMKSKLTVPSVACPGDDASPRSTTSMNAEPSIV